MASNPRVPPGPVTVQARRLVRVAATRWRRAARPCVSGSGVACAGGRSRDGRWSLLQQSISLPPTLLHPLAYPLAPRSRRTAPGDCSCRSANSTVCTARSSIFHEESCLHGIRFAFYQRSQMGFIRNSMCPNMKVSCELKCSILR